MNFLAVDCEMLWPIISLIKNGIIPMIQIGIPIILIVLGILDLGKAVVASSEDEIKKAQKLLIKRAIYAVAIFFVVLFVNIVFGLLSNSGDSYGDQGMKWTDCWNYKK